MNLDATDIRLLALLQTDAQMTSQDLGARLNLSPSQAGRRKLRLEQSGVITHYTARLDPARLGLDVQAFVQVQLSQHGPGPGRDFARLVERRPEIVSAWTLTGEADYLLRVWTPDLAGLNRLIHDVILAHPGVGRVQSQIVMDQLKKDAPLPL
ncbi:Lrp/AsnC family transcriptional regulator [Ponticoccus sp. SC2-23]|uniref:Lrp/AsnC family transcriptional regulator n=1 Tax=Alexandriicola marinus TaxID=2081710 RepID=UPI000FD83C43|nr:Lrp/AsnC family transcriptional regulator [Alexandriicola marinus]MBM1220851.1 Lrp/AsnC family transcriptional regulator [Ponticoccus sp. SC6-9]MBM1225421.1 Lrp/AsnC family transcriptional regulator [Ponticoccus sp. SC6-15]MBM1227604.1 Lrp/AsnC family transcriptional regulator [Ponticoccus sp. SC6-38]MBM1234758.1 Lrp/AsnC family transcriptional regulator [Ponticoccus sp. SC6-45]MBM1238106.1 Lrp/AsnC family transcriptional regulator [Ponticoccus sp. SC6-49]MBM1244261.1 Lrp/AsnC family trans